MKISLEWLSDYVTWQETDPLKIAEAVTRAVGEVDALTVQGERLTHVVVGRVKNLRKHPNADKLSLCDIDTERGLKHVVCGGTNLRDGMLVAFAHVGATVRSHDDGLFTLSPAKIRGEVSEGMICAAEELELTDMFPPAPEDGARPIIALPGTHKVGTPLRDALGLTDVVLHIDNHAITHRPDLFSHIGVARECVTLGLATWKSKKKTSPLRFPKTRVPFAMRIEDPTLIGRYCACAISIDGPGETPLWMRRRLEATGWRSISLPIDITNYVMMDIGVPLHSFDIDDIDGDVHVRKANADETITTLDGVTRKLPAGAIVLSDNKGIFDLLGIMGGLRSSTKASTRHIYLHSASVDPVSIRQTVIATGHRTDAATVYEKGVPPITTEQGFLRACELFLQLVPGARIASVQDSWGKNGTPRTITVRLGKLTTFIGEAIKKTEVTRILKDLGCGVRAGGKDQLKVTPPLWRLKDMKEEVDIFEEVARIHGYNDIPPVMPKASIDAPVRDMRVHALRDAFKEEGFFELLHLAFMSPELLKACGISTEHVVRVMNPIGEDLSVMRPTLFPHILSTIAKQWRDVEEELKVYEIGNSMNADGEHMELCAAMAVRSVDGVEEEPFLRLKQLLLDICTACGYDVTAIDAQVTESWMHPGRSADLRYGVTTVGSLFEVHPRIAEELGVPARTTVARIHLTELLANAPALRLAQALPAFPAIVYDETFPLTKDRSTALLLKKARGAHSLLAEVMPVGAYRDTAATRVTLRFTYRAPDRTLPEEEVAPIHKTVIDSLSRL